MNFVKHRKAKLCVCPGEPCMNNPPTAVGGITTSIRGSGRLGMNHPPTAVGGIPAFQILAFCPNCWTLVCPKFYRLFAKFGYTRPYDLVSATVCLKKLWIFVDLRRKTVAE